jgi:hypothetical protein
MVSLKRTIYLDIDEELTSIVKRLKKSAAEEITLVVPRKAVLLQSIVNLKILKKEANRLGKKIVINTTDKIGKNLSTKAGFVVHRKFESESEIQKDNSLAKNGFFTQEIERENSKQEKTPIKIRDIVMKNKGDLENRGDIYNKGDKGDNLNKGDVGDKGDKINQGNLGDKINLQKTADLPKRKTVFLLPSLSVKFFLGFLTVCFIIVALIALIVLPKAEIVLTPKTEPIILNLEMTIDKNIQSSDIQTNKIPGQIISVQKEKEEEFNATGKKKIYEKARGIITVYNEWDSSPSPLIVNTRFLSKEGKLFRTTKTISVPGFKRVEGKNIPGTIDVEVVAAEAGEEYNIKPTSFKIPAYKEKGNLPKYAGIYGRSAEAMKGGKVGEATVVNKDDLEKAKEFLSQGIKEETIGVLEGEAPEGYKLLEAAIQEPEIEYISDTEIGAITEKFIMKAKSFVQAMIFSEEEIKKIALENLFSKLSNQKEIVSEDEIFDYGTPNLDIVQGQMVLPVHLEGIVRWKIDPLLIREDLIGKNEEELKTYLSDLKEIEKAKVSFWPFWVKRVPLTANRVDIRVEY